MADSSLRIAMLSVHSCPIGKLGTPDTGGMSVYITELARALGRRGYLVDIFTRVHDPAHDTVTAAGAGVRLVHLPAGDDGPVHKLAIYPHLPDFACQIERFRQSDGVRYDLIFSHYWLSGVVGDIVRRWWNVPHLLMFHTLAAAKNAIGIGQEETELRVKTEQDLAADCDRIIASTENEKGDIVRYYGARPDAISAIPCGVNLELFRPSVRSAARQNLGLGNDRIVLYVGRIEPLKGLDCLVQAISLIEQPVRLMVIGGDEESRAETSRLLDLARESGVSDRVNFTGRVDHERLPDFYSAADVCVTPSRYESFGLVSLESLACGTPVVMTRVGGAGQIIRPGENGFIIDANDATLLAESIQRVLAWPYNEGRCAAIRESVRAFTWDRLAQSITREFESTIRSYRSRYLPAGRQS